MIRKIKQTIKSSLFQGSLVILAANIIANFFNYLFHLLTGRMLPVEQYGLLQSFIALSALLGITTNFFSFSVVNLIANKKKTSVASIINILEKQTIKLSFIFLTIVLLLFPLLKTLLHSNSFFIYFIFSLQVIFYFLPVVYQTILRAKLKFFAFGSIGIASTLTKLFSAYIFILAGWQLAGALGAFAVSGIITTYLCWRLINSYWPKTGAKLKKVKLGSSFWNFSLLSLLTNFFLISLYSIDIILARFFLDPYPAGIYAAASVLGKIIFFAGGSVLLVIYPLLVKFKKNPARMRETFWFSLFALSLICILGIIAFRFFPNFIVSLLYGQRYQEAGLFLPSFSIFVSLLVVFNLLIYLFLALEKRMAVWLAGGAAFCQAILIIFRHDNIRVIIDNSIISLFLLFAISLPISIKLLNEKQK